MSVIIKGMKMPDGCPFCPLSHWTRATNEFAGCEIVQSKRYAMLNDIAFAESLAKSRPDWCPLAEIPTPHGRLIDADAIHYSRIRIAHNDGTIGGYNAVVMSAEIKDAPTIIEAEEPDHDT